jgi:hypothetical protein
MPCQATTSLRGRTQLSDHVMLGPAHVSQYGEPTHALPDL